ncbi:hypothetical protein PTKIN_Ptkin13bG0014600 [Pterospermum kingtungense]
MSSLSGRSVAHIFGVTVMVTMTLMMSMIAITYHQSSPLSSLTSAESLLFHQIENEKQSEGEEKDEKANFEEDYGVWNPTPRSGGAYASPVPHPNSFGGLHPFSSSKRS